MSKKMVLLLVVLVASPLILYFALPSDEARIRKLIRETAQAAEQADVKGIMSSISFHYTDNHGLSYLVLGRALERRLNGYSEIDVNYSNLTVTVEGDHARAAMDVRVSASRGQQTGFFMGSAAEPSGLSLELEKNPAGKWQIVSAMYERQL